MYYVLKLYFKQMIIDNIFTTILYNLLNDYKQNIMIS
jgi:hypothetical protein